MSDLVLALFYDTDDNSYSLFRVETEDYEPASII